MQTVADRVDADLRDYHASRGATGTAPIRRRVLVAIDGHGNTEYLVRASPALRRAPAGAVDGGLRRHR